MNQNIINLRLFIDHSISLQADTTVAQANDLFEQTRVHFAAVLKGNKVIGLTSPLAIVQQLEAAKQNDPVSLNCLHPFPIICCTNVATETNINYALSRSDEQLLEDIILIDDSMDFLGLISATTFMRIQKRGYTQKIEQQDNQIGSNIEKINNLENDLQRTHNQLEEHQQMLALIKSMRSAFLARFSHEARTPMTSIQGMLDLLDATKLPKEQKQMLQAANTCIHTLMRLIQSTQDFAEIETDNIHLTETTFSPSSTLDKCIAATKAEADEKGLLVQLEHSEIPEYIIGDQQRFQQVIENLIGNAIDHTQSGGVHIKATELEYSGRLFLKITITDTSKGWEAAEPDQLFNPDPATGTPPMKDIGTIVAERMIHKMGGRIRSHYKETKGCQYTLELPIHVLSPLAKTTVDGTSTLISRPQTEFNRPIDTPTLNVLIIDDNSINLSVARHFLLNLNCNVHIALSGQAGIDKLREHRIDCIFMDCRMPGLSGFETSKLIREGAAGAENSNVFISAMTTQITNMARQECFESGMNYFIPKPVSKRSFEDALTASINEQDVTVVSFSEAATG